MDDLFIPAIGMTQLGKFAQCSVKAPSGKAGALALKRAETTKAAL